MMLAQALVLHFLGRGEWGGERVTELEPCKNIVVYSLLDLDSFM